MTAVLARTEAETFTSLVPSRDGRICLRAVNKPVSPYQSKRNHTGPVSQRARYTVTFTTPPHHH
jgi:hypothetical protein